MKVKIEPRKATDRGGYYCMPLYTNIRMGSRDGGSHSVLSVGRNAGGSHWQKSQRSRGLKDCVRCVRLRREWEHENEE